MNLARLQDIKSIHRKHLHFYILTEKTEREIKESIPFTIAKKRIKYLGINLPKETKNYTQKIIRHWWKKSKMTYTGREIHNAPELEESILWKWLHYQMQSTDSVQFQSNYEWQFPQKKNKNFHNLCGNKKDQK